MRRDEAGDVAEGELGMPVRRADDEDRQRAGRPPVGAEHLGAQHLRPAVEARDAGADDAAESTPLWPVRRGRIGIRIHHRRDDLTIARAATQYAAEGVLDLGLGGVRVRFQQSGAGHQQAGGADAALGGAVAQKGLLQGGQRAVGQPLDSADLGTRRLRHRHEAGAGGLPVDQHGAGAAVAGVAAHLGAGQAEPVAQHRRQPRHRRRLDGDVGAVDAKGDGRRREPHAAASCASPPAAARSARATISRAASTR